MISAIAGTARSSAVSKRARRSWLQAHIRSAVAEPGSSVWARASRSA